ncbi:hypothetical protein COLO4_16422 [Corchorus olitorius]|uniref:Uncharacterized protein n=1 Tax=Corchorus olitorius TaxID=93759 RepID=A0A1R3JHK1_9ROSI|nr:hypothetical protein COLO4_16422 [Corchorus olitorius]
MKPSTLLKSLYPSLHLSLQISRSDHGIYQIFGYNLPLHLATKTPKTNLESDASINGSSRSTCVERIQSERYPNWDMDEEEYLESMWAVSWQSR